MCYGVTGTNARGELFNQNATDKTSGRFALKAVQFAGEGSPEPIAAIWVAGEKQPVGNLAFHADSPLPACGPGRWVAGAWNSKAARLRLLASLRAVLICVDLRTRLPMIRPVGFRRFQPETALLRFAGSAGAALRYPPAPPVGKSG